MGLTGKSDQAIVDQLPEDAGKVSAASEYLYKRVNRLEQDILAPPDENPASPARSLLGRLERAF